MDICDAINIRRSVRQYTDEPVPRQVLKRIIAAGVEEGRRKNQNGSDELCPLFAG